MATATLDVSSVISATGWSGATVANLSTSNDVRATDGTAGELIHAELGDAPGDFTSLNTVTLHVEARRVGTVNRDKTVLVELLNSSDTVLESFTTGVLGASDATYNSSAFSRSDSLATVNGYRLRATVQEGGGMPDSATVEIDRMWVTLDYAAGVNPSVSDSLTPSVTDTGSVVGIISGSEGLTPALSETSTSSLSSGRSETLAPSVTDSASSLIIVGGVETLTPSVGDTLGVLVSVVPGDTATPSVGEALGIYIEEDPSETLTPNLTDTGNVVTYEAPGILGGSFGSFSFGEVSFGGQTEITEAVSVELTETLTPSVSDASSITRLLTTTDSLTPGVTELYSLFNQYAISDLVTPSVAEVVSFYKEIGLEDTPTPSVGSSLSILVSVSRTEGLVPSLGDTSQNLLLLDRGDSVLASVGESSTSEGFLQLTEGLTPSTLDVLLLEDYLEILRIRYSWKPQGNVKETWTDSSPESASVWTSYGEADVTWTDLD